MNMTVMIANPRRINQSFTGFIDCDVHPFFKTPDEFDAFLPERWREHRRTIGGRTRQGLAKASNYPRMSPGNGQRMDAWPPDGTHPGSDLPFMQQQLLDLFNVAYGLLAPLVGGAGGERNVEFGAAMATAINEWQLARWCDPDPRLKAAVHGECRARVGGDRGDREARRRPSVRAGADPAARAGAAGAAALLADPRGVRRERLPDLAASRRHRRPSIDRRRASVVLSRGASVLRAVDADAGDQPGLRGRVRAHPQPEDRAGGRRLRLAAGAVLAARQGTGSGCTRKCRSCARSRPSMCGRTSG